MRRKARFFSSRGAGELVMPYSNRDKRAMRKAVDDIAEVLEGFPSDMKMRIIGRVFEETFADESLNVAQTGIDLLQRLSRRKGLFGEEW